MAQQKKIAVVRVENDVKFLEESVLEMLRSSGAKIDEVVGIYDSYCEAKAAIKKINNGNKKSRGGLLNAAKAVIAELKVKAVTSPTVDALAAAIATTEEARAIATAKRKEVVKAAGKAGKSKK